MKTIYVTFRKVRYYEMPVAMPSHWAHRDIRNALEKALAEDTDLTNLLAGLDWETGASWHVQAGTPLPVLKELGGWASLDIVLRYAHLGADHLAEHAEQIARPSVVCTNSGTVPEKIAATG